MVVCLQGRQSYWIRGPPSCPYLKLTGYVCDDPVSTWAHFRGTGVRTSAYLFMRDTVQPSDTSQPSFSWCGRLLLHPPPEPAYVHPHTHTGILRCPLVWSLGCWWWGYGSAAGHPVCFSPLKRGEEMSLFIHLIQCLSTRWFLLTVGRTFMQVTGIRFKLTEVEEGVNCTSTQTLSCWVGLGARWFHRWYQEASLLDSLSVSSCPLSLSSFLPFSLCLYLSVSPVPSGLLFNSCVLTLALRLGSILRM